METLRIMVVDDEPGIRSGIQRILRNFTVDFPFMEEQFNFAIEEADTGEKAIEVVDSNPPDIMLLDNKLPGILGVNVLEYIKKKQLDIIVIMITSHASLDLAVNATKSGAFDFVPKPFTPAELKTSIENVAKHFILRRMTKRLNQEGRQIRFQFLSVLSHELKAPLNAVEGYLKMIQEKRMGPNVDEYQTMIERSLARINGMRQLIMDMLDLTRIESGKKKREIKSVNLIEVAQTAIDTMQPYAIQRDVKINLKTRELIKLNADSEEIEIIFNNLISNAIKYNIDGGRVEVTISSDDKEITITVSDTGIGMEPEEVAIIFDDFVRIKNPKTKAIAGTGLGLPIVKKLVEMYGGNISVISIPDRGTTFTVVLPVV